MGSDEDLGGVTVTRKMHPAHKNLRDTGLRELDRLMRERAGLAPAPVPVPLHKMGQQRAKRAATTTGGQRP